MRGEEQQQSAIFSYMTLESRIPRDHPLRRMRTHEYISRRGNPRLRRALYMPALSAARFDPHMKAFYNLLQTRHKTKLQALTAVARKLLHAIFCIFKTGTVYDGAKLFPQIAID